LFKPFVTVSEEVTDNIFETPANKRTEYTTRVRPGATFHYLSPLWTWDSSYTFEYRNYARKSAGDNYLHDGMLKGTIALVENFLFVDLSDTYHRISLDVARDITTESSLFLNQTDQNIATVSPYLLWRLRGDNTLKTGYRFTDTRYWEPVGIDSQQHNGFADLTHEFSSKLSIYAGYDFTRLESKPSLFNKHDLYGGFKYEYADKSFVFGKIGNSWQKFDIGLDVNYLFWDVGVTHDFRFALATVETKVTTSQDPLAVSTKETDYSGKLEKNLQRGMISMYASYAEYVNTATNQMFQNKLSLSASGRYEVMQDLSASMTATGERFNKRTVLDYPYRFTGVAGLSYALKDELTIGLTYTYVNYLLGLDTTVGSKQINKAVIDLKKSF
jgi:opacity protein-like surface antigen